MIKFAVLLFVAAAYVVSAVPIEGKDYPRYIQFPDGDGNLHDVDLEAEPDYELLQEIQRNPANNLYLLFTRANPTSSQTLVMNDGNSIRNSNFNRNRVTVVVVHGWLSNQETDINPAVRDAVLGRYDANVIVMDWRRLAISDYVTAARGVPDVGRGLGQFINFLNRETGLSLNNVHLVGFSLGSHVVGNAGRELGGRVARVTGLDPAGPLWTYSSNKISSNDAIYVEAIHTDGNTLVGLGIGTNVANADFYPNGGYNQPGCITGICDHNRAWRFFAATVTHNHLVANECSSSLQISLNSCRGAQLHMGNNDLRKSGSGMFRVNTGRNYPY
ncbi:pancreatic triacylglycerol lipase-like [Hyposmocoma kahamanoa]|uniref:pancreatic triacylglycerol lipase-like n=1 Tax=Hyposmocoma kahamanoa TaxID=1477025 RepID=UPI000E6D61C2|nr:pancreatic triacylglycerol lipase-like [Hyposmocoma kahamanoa]